MQIEQLHRILEGPLLLGDDSPERRMSARPRRRDTRAILAGPAGPGWERDSVGALGLVRVEEGRGHAE